MKIQKKVLTQLEGCYATGYTVVDNEIRIMLATEEKGACYQFSGSEFEKSTVWDGPGGTMCIVQIPEKNGDFLSVQNFFPTFQAENSTIVWGKPNTDGSWDIKTFFKLPYLHRFDILRANGVNYFLGATLCTTKKHKEDWSDPGKIWVGALPDTSDGKFEIHPIKEGLVRNHGYCHVSWNNKEAGIVTCDQGAFVVMPPEQPDGEWTIENILDRPVSDIAICDIDEDGELELVTIEPFHGKEIAISKKINGTYEIIWKYDKPVDFGHVVWGGKLRGIPTFICGYREQEAELFLIQYDSKNPLKFKVEVIDTGMGPSNITVINGEEKDIIIAANRVVGEAALYIVTD